MDADLRDIKVIYDRLADLLNYAHLCFFFFFFFSFFFLSFFVSLDQLLCNRQPLPHPSSFTTIRKGTDPFGYFSFYKATFSQRSLSVFAPAFSVIVKGVLCAHFRK